MLQTEINRHEIDLICHFYFAMLIIHIVTAIFYVFIVICSAELVFSFLVSAFLLLLWHLTFF